MMRKILFLLISACSWTVVSAQYETTMPAMRSLYQSSYINPAFVPEYKLSIGLPVLNNLGLRMTLTGIDLHMVASSVSKDSNYLSMNTLYSKLDGPIGFIIPIQTDLFYIRFPIKGYYIGINSTLKIDQTYNISKEFIGFAAMGNDFFKGINQDYELLKIKMSSYAETGISISKEYKRFSFGVRVKYLKGIANMQTSNIRLVFNTDSTPPFPISISTSGTIQTAGLPMMLGADSIDGKPIQDADKNYDAKRLLQKGNDGWGLDIGLGYQFSTKLSGWLSVIDIGSSVTWNRYAYNYKLDPAVTKFGGFSNDQANNKNGARDRMLDSLGSSIGKSYVTKDSYKTVIPTRYYFGVDYDLSLRTRVSLMFQGFDYLGTFNTAYTGIVNQRIIRNWQMTGNFSLKNYKNYDLGFGTSLGFGPMQFYFMADNLWSLIQPSRARDLYFKLGIQMVFGRVIKAKKMFI